MKLISTSNLKTEQAISGKNEFRILLVLIYITVNATHSLAQNATSADSVFSEPSASVTTRTLFGGTITDFGYGGPAIKFSRFNNQLAIMPGGRGACIINDRYTLGGGGYGIANSIKLQDSGTDTDTTRYYKMGYGGLEFGYIFFTGRKLNFGGTLLLAAGAEFLESKAESNNEISYGSDFRIIPVLEPSFYVELKLNNIIRLHTGISYRFVRSSDLDNIHVPNMSGFSCYLGLLFGRS